MNGNDAQKAQAVKEFLGWLSRYSPEVHAAVMEAVPEAAYRIAESPHMAGLGQQDIMVEAAMQTQPTEKPWWQKALDIAGSVGTQYLQYKAQQDVLEVQRERAKQGLPPIPSDMYAPTIRHQVDVPPEFKRAAMGTGTLLAIGAGLLGLFFLANR